MLAEELGAPGSPFCVKKWGSKPLTSVVATLEQIRKHNEEVHNKTTCCFPSNLASHTCKHRYKHAERGTAISWDDAVQSSRRHFEHKSYNLFTCNCHSFVANCLNRICYGGSMSWNMMNVAALVLFKGQWVDAMAVTRSFLPFSVMVCFGVGMVGWPFLIGLLSFCLLLIAWFSVGAYCLTNLLEC